MPFFLRILAVITTFIVFGQSAISDEIKGGDADPSLGRTRVTPDGQMKFAGRWTLADVIKRNSNEVARYVCEQRDTRAGGIPDNRFCEHWPAHEDLIAEVSKVMGYPPQLITCILLIETKFREGQCSAEAACGRAQYRLPTAIDAENAMKKTAEYQRDFKTFRENVQRPSHPRNFNRKSLRSLKGNEDVQYFAVAFYFRHFVGKFEEQWLKLIQADPAHNIRKYYQFLAISFNAGPGAGIEYMNEVKSGLTEKVKARETQKYMPLLNKCLGFEAADPIPGGLRRKECQALGAGESCEDVIAYRQPRRKPEVPEPTPKEEPAAQTEGEAPTEGLIEATSTEASGSKETPPASAPKRTKKTAKNKKRINPAGKRKR